MHDGATTSCPLVLLEVASLSTLTQILRSRERLALFSPVSSNRSVLRLSSYVTEHAIERFSYLAVHRILPHFTCLFFCSRAYTFPFGRIAGRRCRIEVRSCDADFAHLLRLWFSHADYAAPTELQYISWSYGESAVANWASCCPSTTLPPTCPTAAQWRHANATATAVQTNRSASRGRE